ncbi:MAG: tRNA (guanosine(37)-N1)-methyltransferase TrmD, partial [Candidatus Omnitrophota bacterium]
MQIDILTLFPQMFYGILEDSILKRAQQKGSVKINLHNLRDWARDRRGTVDDKPYGGGPGMVLKPEPVFEACDDLCGKNTVVILLTPQGVKLKQKIVKQFLKHNHLLLICGHYEGFDERIRSLADYEISIGDYILTGGEIPAMVVVDAVVRLIPGVLGQAGSLEAESFNLELLEYPQFTRPQEYRGMKIPEVILSGNHQRIETWRKEQALKKTKHTRN